MAVVTTFSHAFLEEVLQAEHNLASDTLKVILMDTTFSFDPDTHSTYDSTVQAAEISTAGGYTVGGETLSNVAVSIGTSQVDVDADNVTWTATGAAMDTVGSAIIYNSTHTSDTVVMCIDFGADYLTGQDKLFQINFSAGLAVVDNG